MAIETRYSTSHPRMIAVMKSSPLPLVISTGRRHALVKISYLRTKHLQGKDASHQGGKNGVSTQVQV
ncbi:MAG: hypothetical protein VXV97_01735, partial [Pseudomonadota bacterium]|nr:hypothetical protein [Pseudomonadota bacterium]